MMGCGATIQIDGAKRYGCILLDRHSGEHKALVPSVHDSSATRPEGVIQGAEGRAVVSWFDKEPMFTVCTPCHAKLHWHCHGEWQDPDGHHICNCGCEAA